MRPNKRSKLSSAVALLNGIVVKKILYFDIKGLSLNQKLEMTLGFINLYKVRHAAVYGAVTLMRWLKTSIHAVTRISFWYELNLSNGVRLMLCSFRGLVTEAVKDEMQSSSCPLVTTPNLMLSSTSVFCSKGYCLVLKIQDPSRSYWIAKRQQTYHACQRLPDYHKYRRGSIGQRLCSPDFHLHDLQWRWCVSLLSLSTARKWCYLST